MSNDIIKIKIDADALIAALPRPEEGQKLCGAGIIALYLVDILNEAGIEAEAQFLDLGWCVTVMEDTCYVDYDATCYQEESVLRSIQYFSLNLKNNNFDAWYSYNNKIHYLNIRMRESKEESEEV